MSQHLAYIQFENPEVLPDFMLFFLQGRYGHLRQVSQAGGSTKGALTCAFLKTYPVPMPPLEEQRKIAWALQSVGKKLQVEKDRACALDALFKSLLHFLMAGKIRVTEFAEASSAAGD